MPIETTSAPNYAAASRISAAAIIVAALTGAGAVGYFNPSNVKFFPVCPLYAMTGLACPGCGLTRAFHAFFHGDLFAALDFNALFPFFAFILGYFFVSLVLVAIRGRGLSFEIFKPKFLYGFLVLSFAFAILRNLPIYPFSVLYP